MAILAIVDPAPVMRQPQVQPEFIQVRVCCSQVLFAGGAALADGVVQRFLEVQRSVHQALCHRMAVDLREFLGFGQQPRQ